MNDNFRSNAPAMVSTLTLSGELPRVERFHEVNTNTYAPRRVGGEYGRFKKLDNNVARPNSPTL